MSTIWQYFLQFVFIYIKTIKIKLVINAYNLVMPRAVMSISIDSNPKTLTCLVELKIL